jgi:protein-L-isoaspartate(D-aspartate) O-methyltransferase
MNEKTNPTAGEETVTKGETFSLKTIILLISGATFGLFSGLIFPLFLHGSTNNQATALNYNQIQSMIQEQTESKARVNTTGETLATNSTFEAVIDEPYPIEENLAELMNVLFGEDYEALKNERFAQDEEGFIEYLKEIYPDSKEAFVQYMMENRGEEREFLEDRWELAGLFVDSKELRGNAIPAFLQAPREYFVRPENLNRAYADTWMPIGWGATITDPDVVSMMTTSLDLQPGERVLEIGTGSGYQSSILSFMTDEVYSIEIIEPLYHETNEIYIEKSQDYPTFNHIRRKLDDGFYGWEKYAPFDAIIVTCAIDHLPPPLLKQLAPDGVMVVPLGPPGRQYIMEIIKTEDENGNVSVSRRDVYNGLSVKFIPFRDNDGTSYSRQ